MTMRLLFLSVLIILFTISIQAQVTNIYLSSENPYISVELSETLGTQNVVFSFEENGITFFCNNDSNMISIGIAGTFDWLDIVRDTLPLVECPDPFAVHEGDILSITSIVESTQTIIMVFVPNTVLATIAEAPILSHDSPIIRRIISKSNTVIMPFDVEPNSISMLVTVVVDDYMDTTGVEYALQSDHGYEDHDLCTLMKSCTQINYVSGEGRIRISARDPGLFGDPSASEVLIILLPPTILSPEEPEATDVP